jgi:cytochrome c6
MSILPNAPHFAKGDRMEKPDALLISSIANGLNIMPPWKSVLNEQQISEILAYVRTLAK